MTTDHMPAAAYLAIVGAPDASEREIDAATYRERYGQTANDLVPKLRSKYRNEPTEVDGHRFASLAEARRYMDLKRLQDAGEISQLRLQPRYPIVINGIPVCVYVADFSYIGSTGIVVEDVKGVRTAVYRLKNKLMRAVHGIDITEVGR